MDDQGEKLVQNLAIGGALIFVGYKYVLSPILSALNINPADTAAIENQQNVPPALNPWSTQFMGLDQQLNRGSDGTLVPMASWYQQWKGLYDDGTLTPPQPGNEISDVANAAETIKDALAWYHLTTDGNAIVAAFNGLVSQKEVSELASYFLYNFGEDLFTAMQGTLFKPGLTSAELASVIAHVNTLPQQ